MREGMQTGRSLARRMRQRSGVGIQTVKQKFIKEHTHGFQRIELGGGKVRLRQLW